MRLLLLSALLAGVAGKCIQPTKERVLGKKGASEYCCSKYCCSKKVGDKDCDCGYGDKPMKPEPRDKEKPKQCGTTKGGVATTNVKDPEDSKNFDFDDFLSSKVKDLKKACTAADGKWLGTKKNGNCFSKTYEETWCAQISKDKKGCKKAKADGKKVCKYKKERKNSKKGKKDRDAKCAIKKK